MVRPDSSPYRDPAELVRIHPDQLQQPPDRSARAIARALLDAAVACRDRLELEGTAGSVHDFRVAVRRLRSWLEAFDAWLGDEIPRKARRNLRRAARATNDRRDLDVHMAWVEEQHAGLSKRQWVGARWLLAELQAQRSQADERARHRAVVAFDRARKRLPLWTADDDGDGSVPDAPRTFAGAVAQLATEHADALRTSMEAIRGNEDEKTLHAARIAAKRLRYLVEPVDACLPDGRALLGRLRALQDGLGEAHDVTTFAGEYCDLVAHAAGEQARRLAEMALAGDAAADAPRQRDADPLPGLLAIGRRLRARRAAALQALRADWLSDGGRAFDRRLRVSLRALTADGGAGPKSARVRRREAAAARPK